MSGVITDLKVAATLAGRHVARRLQGKTDTAPDAALWQQQFTALLQAAGSAVSSFEFITLPATEAPWLNTGIELQQGETISLFNSGRIYANKALDIWLEPTLQVWFRLGDGGRIFRGTRQSHSLQVTETAELQLGNYFPNDWIDLNGKRLQDDSVYAANSGETCLLLIRWSESAEHGLQALLTHGDVDEAVDKQIAKELELLNAGDTTPSGWHYLWNLGPSEIYQTRRGDDGNDCIHCHTHKDVGILQHPVDLALDENTEISWRWLLEQLPATLREDSVPSHDYLSLAVEFDNGRDISYYWSSTLPQDYGFDCPLPNWQGKEYHVVVRSGNDGVGEWQNERRNLYADYQQYMGKPPQRIVAIWLIANSIFMRGHGICDYADIQLHQGAESKRIL
jgi:hypothetical protein